MEDYPKTAELKDGRTIVLRPLTTEDPDRLLSYFQALPEEERVLFRDDVTDPDVIQRWAENIDLESVIPVVAEDGDKIVADGTLHMTHDDWMQHVAYVRQTFAKTHRDVGLERLLLRELVTLAQKRGLETLLVEIIGDDSAQAEWFRAFGFKTAAILRGVAKDRNGAEHDLTILANDVGNAAQALKNRIPTPMLLGRRMSHPPAT